MAELCALAYTLQAEELDRLSAINYQAAVLAQAQGAKVDIPDLTEARRRFDRWLIEDPQQIDPAQAIKARALGLTKGR
jgi:hypothetical protein